MRPLSLSSLLSRRETAWRPVTPIHVRNGAAMALAATSGATDAIGYLTLGHIFTSAMTGNLVLLGISLGHHNGERAGRVLVSLVCFMFGAAFGARIARSPKPDDPVRPPAVTAALAIEVPIFIAYAACWWAVGARPDSVAKVVLLGLGAIALGIQSSTMQRFGAGLNTTFLSGALTLLVGQLATGHRPPTFGTTWSCWWVSSAAGRSRRCWWCTRQCSRPSPTSRVGRGPWCGAMACPHAASLVKE
jgi:uncharacterized membrane protein YoaK (UPF0700 family)